MSWLGFVVRVVLVTAAAVFSGGALLWVGGRFVAKVPRLTWWRSVGTYAFVVIVGAIVYAIVSNILRAALGPSGTVPARVAGLVAGAVLLGYLTRWLFDVGSRRAIAAWLPVLGQVVAVLAIVASVRAGFRGLEDRAACRGELGRLGDALQRHAAAHDGRLPRDLSSLASLSGSGEPIPRCPAVPAEGSSGSYFYCPPPHPGEEGGEGGSPVEAPPVAPPPLAPRILACDLRANHGGQGRNVLHDDGWVRWRSEARFQAELAEPRNAAFARALRAAEAR